MWLASKTIIIICIIDFHYIDNYFADGIIIGGSNIDHIVANVKACEEGPLDASNLFQVHFMIL